MNSIPRVCIIGSGPGGAFAAIALAKAGFSVMVVEGGTELQDSDQSRTIDRLDILGGARPNFGFSRQVGGSSNLWAGRVAPLETIDFEERPWVPMSGWPITRAELSPYYTSALEIMGLPDLEAVGLNENSVPDEWSDFIQQAALKKFVWSTPPFLTAKYLKANLTEYADRLKIITGTQVTSLEVSSCGSRIIAANAIEQGQFRKFEADYFIVAAGGVETPRLLLNSNQHCPEGLGNRFDNVGRYLSTHPKADIGLMLLKHGSGIGYSAFTDQTNDNVRIRTGIGLTADVQARLGTLNHYVQLTPIFEYQANRAFELLKGRMTAASPLLNRSAAVRGVLPGLGLIVYETIGRLAGLQKRVTKFVLRGFLDQIPSPSNRVSLSGTIDEYGCRKANIKWTFSDADKQSVLLFLGEIDKAFAKAGLGRLDYSMLHEGADWPITGIHSHFMGTTRMGVDPKTSVINGNCQIHGLENCFISGPSTFPTYGYANPFLTIAALSLRLADHLCDRVCLSS